MATMAMFPLGSVLFPGAVLPLHVFEPRYRQMVQDCLASDEPEFGVALIDRGSEVGGGDIRSMVGTVARIMQVAETDDGRYALIAVGVRRIRVDYWLPDDPCPRAEVSDWPDSEDYGSEIEQALATSLGRVRRVNALATELGEVSADATSDISDDPLLGSYHLSVLAPVGPADQQRLLAASGPSERLRLLTEAIDDVEAGLRFRLACDSAGDFDGDTHGEMPGDIDEP